MKIKKKITSTPVTEEKTHSEFLSSESSAVLFTGSSHDLAGRQAEAALLYKNIFEFGYRFGAYNLSDSYPKVHDYLLSENILRKPHTGESVTYISDSPIAIQDSRLFIGFQIDHPAHHDHLDKVESKATPHLKFFGEPINSYEKYTIAVHDILQDQIICSLLWKKVLKSAGITLPVDTYLFLKKLPHGIALFEVITNKDLFQVSLNALDYAADRPGLFLPSNYEKYQYGNRSWINEEDMKKDISSPGIYEYSKIKWLKDLNEFFDHSNLPNKFNFNRYYPLKHLGMKTSIPSNFLDINPASMLLNELYYAAQRYVVAIIYGSDTFKDDLCPPVISGLHELQQVDQSLNEFLETHNIFLPSIDQLVCKKAIEETELLGLLKRAKRFREWFELAKLDNTKEIINEMNRAIKMDTTLKKTSNKPLRWTMYTGAGMAFDALTMSPLVGTSVGTAISAFDSFLHDRIKNGWKPSHFIYDDYIPTVARAASRI
ncbi:MAG: hypothetical protein JKX72_08175 [Robiginitomaculum sp.]|nr:hypothetical protein [Robiginitomaculum sp.]